MRIVISQPMYFPWVGLLEQIRLSDHFVHYSDVQFARGFINRVQIKTLHGVRWATVPLRGLHRGQRIDEIELDNSQDWRSDHLALLKRAYTGALFQADALAIVDAVFSASADTLADVARESTMALVKYFGLSEHCSFHESSQLGIAGKSSQRLFDICRYLDATRYITGHGARCYLDHSLFEAGGIRVEYMDYLRLPYAQLHGDFTPHVSALDLVANCGREGVRFICSGTRYWKEFLHESY